MGQLSICEYLSPGSTMADVARAFNEFHNMVRSLTDAQVDGSNIHTRIAGEGLDFTTGTRTTPKKLKVPIADTTGSTYIRKKGTSGSEKGMEILVDPTDATYGRFCVVDVDTPTVQRWSCIIDDPASVGTPGATMTAPTGAMTINTGVAADVIIKRNSTTQATLDGTSLLLPAANALSWSTDLRLTRPAAGKLLLSDPAGGSTAMIQLGGTTSSFPAISRNGTETRFVTADGGAFANVKANAFDTGDGQGRFASDDVSLASGGTVEWSSSSTDATQAKDVRFSRAAAGKALLADPSGGNINPMLLLFDATSASPSLKRQGAVLECRLADDSAYTDFTSTKHDVYLSTTRVISVGRSGHLQLGSGVPLNWASTTAVGTPDAELERAAAGKVLLTDPSGGVTAPMFILGAASTAGSALKLNSGVMEIKEGDDSAYGPFKGLTLEATTEVITPSVDSGAATDLLLQRNNSTRLTVGDTAITGAVTYSSPGAGSFSERYGVGAVAAGAGAVAVGYNASAGHEAAQAYGLSATSTAINQLVYGSTEYEISDAYIGAGVVSETPPAIALNATGGSGTNIAGAEFTLAGGKGTGTGAGGPITLKIAPAGGSGSSLNSLVEAFKVYATSDGIVINETGADRDVRIEGDTDTKLFFVDASADRIGVGTISPSYTLDVSGTFGVSLAATFGDVRLTNSNQTASNGGSYAVAAGIGTVFVNASALTAAQNFTVTLPSAVTYAARFILVKISVAGAATSTITVGSSAGNVEGSASQAWDTSVLSGAVFCSNGTDWYYISTYGLA